MQKAECALSFAARHLAAVCGAFDYCGSCQIPVEARQLGSLPAEIKEYERTADMSREKDAQYQGLYRPEFEHDNCGIGAVVNIKGVKNHETVADALKIVENLEHRAGKDAEGKTGDGVGILLQISHQFFSKVCQPLGFSLPAER